jgi:protein required for attachment to host cells
MYQYPGGFVSIYCIQGLVNEDKVMANTWVLVADSSRARIFAADSPTSALTEFRTMVNPLGRQHEQDMTSDLPGSQAGHDGRHHAVSGETDPKKTEAINFAKSISDYLEESISKHGYTKLVVVAAPAFLGLLREHMTPESIRRVTLELNKDLTQHSTDDIRQHLPKRLPGAVSQV